MNRYETHSRWEEPLGVVLAVVGIAIVWGVALNTAADQPFQHTGTQTLERIK